MDDAFIPLETVTSPDMDETLPSTVSATISMSPDMVEILPMVPTFPDTSPDADLMEPTESATIQRLINRVRLTFLDLASIFIQEDDLNRLGFGHRFGIERHSVDPDAMVSLNHNTPEIVIAH
jgi:hypothetical protein